MPSCPYGKEWRGGAIHRCLPVHTRIPAFLPFGIKASRVVSCPCPSLLPSMLSALETFHCPAAQSSTGEGRTDGTAGYPSGGPPGLGAPQADLARRRSRPRIRRRSAERAGAPPAAGARVRRLHRGRRRGGGPVPVAARPLPHAPGARLSGARAAAGGSAAIRAGGEPAGRSCSSPTPGARSARAGRC